MSKFSKVIILLIIAGSYLHYTGNTLPLHILNSTEQIIRNGLKELKPSEKKEVKKIEWGEILTQIKSKVALQATTIQSQGSVKVTIEETLNIATFKLFGTTTSFGFGYSFNGNTTLDPSKITIEESDSLIKITLPEVTLQLSEVKFVKTATDSDTFQGKKIGIQGVPNDATIGPVILRLENSLNNSELLQKKVHSDLLKTQEGKKILPESQKVITDYYSDLIKQIIKAGEVESPKKIKIYFTGQSSFREMTTIGTNEKIVPIIDHKLTEVIQEIQNNFGGDVKLVLSVNSGTSTITQAKELGAPAKVEEIKPLEDKNDEGIEIEAE